LKKALESSHTEVRLRAERALLAIAVLSIEGEFVRVASESFSQSGKRTVRPRIRASTLSVEKGRVIFKQDYAKGIEQIYSFPEETKLLSAQMLHRAEASKASTTTRITIPTASIRSSNAPTPIKGCVWFSVRQILRERRFG